MKKTINDIFNYTSANSLELLSSYPSAFWQDYRTNYARYDSIFRRLYKSYVYFMQEEGDTIPEIYTQFSTDVYNHLLINDKKYSELYRMHVITDDKYSITDNYNMIETMDRETSAAGSTTSGSRSDSGSATTGTQSNSSTGKVAPYDTETFYNQNSLEESMGARTDTNTFTKGEQVDASTTSGEEAYTLTRKGNIGVQTGTDMLDKHQALWSRYEFYAMIFREICAELLLVGR